MMSVDQHTERAALMHRVVVGAWAGVAASILPSLAARLAMALMVILAGEQPTVTGGTVTIMVMGAFLGAFLGIYYALMVPHLPDALLAQVGVFGSLLLIVFMIPYALGQAQGTLINVQLAPQLVYYVTPFVFTLFLIPIYRWLISRYPMPDWAHHKPRTVIAYGSGALISGIALLAGWAFIALFGLGFMLKTVGYPLFRLIVHGKLPAVTAGLIASVALGITLPALFIVGLLIPLRRIVPGPARAKALVLGLLLIVLYVVPAYLVITSGNPATRLATLGAVTVAVLFVLGGGIASLHAESLSLRAIPRPLVIHAAITAAAFAVLVMTN